MKKEVWKDVENYEGFYQVSNLGRIKSVERELMKSNGVPYTAREKILRPAIDKCGYERVSLAFYNTAKTHKVHRLVAKAFCSGYSSIRGEVNHKNGIKNDNHFKNLEWVTHSTNIKHAYSNKLMTAKRGSSNNLAKLKESDIPKIRQMFNDGMSSRKIAAIYGMDKTVFLDIKNGKLWSHVK